VCLAQLSLGSPCSCCTLVAACCFLLLCSDRAARIIGAASNAILNGWVGPKALQAVLEAIDHCLLGLGLTFATTYVTYLAKIWPTFAFPDWLPCLPDRDMVALLEHRVLVSLSGFRFQDADKLKAAVEQASDILVKFELNQPHLVVSDFANHSRHAVLLGSLRPP
jgi:hypothetical protein